jgi:hypothetical protein
MPARPCLDARAHLHSMFVEQSCRSKMPGYKTDRACALSSCSPVFHVGDVSLYTKVNVCTAPVIAT